MSPEFITMLEEAIDMFAFLAVELTILFLAVSYLVGVLQEYITPEKVRATLSSRNGRGYVIAAFLGAITPFCSCSTIPFLRGLLKARAGFGPMMVFLLSSPLLNPIVIGLLVITFGLNVAVFYFTLAMTVSISAGYILERLGFERYIRDEAYQEASSCGSSSSDTANTSQQDKPLAPESTLINAGMMNTATVTASPASATAALAVAMPAAESPTTSSGSATASTSSASSNQPEAAQSNRWLRIWHSTWKDFKNTLPYLLLGITLGSLIYGFVPTDLIVEYAGDNKWYAVPIAAVIGIPLYIRASAVIPLSAGLVQKGMALGSVMALIIGSAGASLTEVILLKSIFKTQMIAAFLAVVLGMAVTAGYLYSFIF